MEDNKRSNFRYRNPPRRSPFPPFPYNVIDFNRLSWSLSDAPVHPFNLRAPLQTFYPATGAFIIFHVKAFFKMHFCRVLKSGGSYLAPDITRKMKLRDKKEIKIFREN